MRQRAIARGLRLNEYGLFKSTEETRDPKLRLDCKTEEDIFAALDLAYIPPELREDKGEFDAGEAGKIPPSSSGPISRARCTTTPTGATAPSRSRRSPTT